MFMILKKASLSRNVATGNYHISSKIDKEIETIEMKESSSVSLVIARLRCFIRTPIIGIIFQSIWSRSKKTN